MPGSVASETPCTCIISVVELLNP